MCLEEKRKARLNREVQKKSDEIAKLQRKVQNAEVGWENPVSAKKLPLKDVPEARKLIEFLWTELVDAKCAADLSTRKESESVWLTKYFEIKLNVKSLIITHR